MNSMFLELNMSDWSLTSYKGCVTFIHATPKRIETAIVGIKINYLLFAIFGDSNG